jgi:colicin import membrane protein
MRFIKFFSLTGLLAVSLSYQIFAQSQTPADKKAAELKKLETAVNNAQAKVTLNERKLAIADSLITTGNQLIADSKAENKSIQADQKSLDKQYAADEKPLIKQANGKDKDAAKKANEDLKALDLKYKADNKALDTRDKEATKKATTGEADITKGKTAKKAAEEALKTSQTSLDAAKAKYDAAANPDESGTKDKKKKK